jgi:hypothetical protein
VSRFWSVRLLAYVGPFATRVSRLRANRVPTPGRRPFLVIGAAIETRACLFAPLPAGRFGQYRSPDGFRYWRYIELEGELVESDLEMLRRIDPEGSTSADLGGADLETAWKQAAASIVEEHNLRADPRAAQEAIGPAQRFALELLRDPTVILPEGAERAEEALSVERSSAVRRELNGIQAELREERISASEAAAQVVRLVERLGLQPVSLDDVPAPIEEDDLGVVCWMVVLPVAR